MQGLDEDDAVQTFHERDLEAKVLRQQKVDRAVAAEQELHRDGADEGRHDQRDNADALDQRASTEVETGGDIGQRQGDNRCHDHGHRRDVEGVHEGTAEQRRAEEIAEILERQGSCMGILEGDIGHLQDGKDEKRQQEDCDRDARNCGAGQLGKYAPLPCRRSRCIARSHRL